MINTFPQPMAELRCSWNPVRWIQTPPGVISPASSARSTSLRGWGGARNFGAFKGVDWVCLWKLCAHNGPSATDGSDLIVLQHRRESKRSRYTLADANHDSLPLKTRRSPGCFCFLFVHGGVSTSRCVRCQTEEITLLGGVHLLIFGFSALKCSRRVKS